MQHLSHGTPMMTLLLCISLLAIGDPALARTWYVVPDGSGDAPTISAALDSAGAGDDVLLAPGIFFEHDLALPEGVWLHSLAGREATTINGGGSGPIVIASNLENGSTVEGLTLYNGRGGIRALHSNLEVRDCKLLENQGNGNGGGLYCEWAAPGRSIALINTVLEGNSAGFGGGVFSWYPPILGMEGDGTPPTVALDGCTFIQNSASRGGAVAVSSSAAVASDCSFVDNVASTEGGAWHLSGPMTFQIVRSHFEGNHAPKGGALYVGGGDDGEVDHCLLVRNSASSGGGIYSYQSGFTIRSCTLVENGASIGSGVFTDHLDHPRIETSIIAYGIGGSGIHAATTASIPNVMCCDVFGNAGGGYSGRISDQTGLNGNVSLAPLFCGPAAGDYHLDATSPCLGAPGCGLIGALGQGCDGVRTSVNEGESRRISWGRAKVAF